MLVSFAFFVKYLPFSYNFHLKYCPIKFLKINITQAPTNKIV